MSAPKPSTAAAEGSTQHEPPARLETLERRCRALGRVAWLGFFIGAFAVTVLFFQRIGERGGPLRAQGFLLEDFDGVVRASLDLHAGESEVRLSLNDEEGRSRILAFIAEGGFPMFQIRDVQGRARAVIGVVGDGVPALVLSGADGAPRVSMRAEGGRGRLLVRAGEDGEDLVFPPRGEDR